MFMKVLILINSLGAGGAERSMVEYAKFLQKAPEIEFKIVCLKHKEVGLEEEVADAGITTLYHRGNSFKSKLSFFNRLIEREKPDLVHSVLTESNLIARASKLSGRKFTLIQSLVNTPYSIERKKDNQLSWFKFQIMKQIDIVSARLTKQIYYHSITYEVLEHYKSLYNIKDNYMVIYRGRESNEYCNYVKKKDRFTIINSGRQEFAKGQIDILKALHYLERNYGVTEIDLEILGRSGTYSKILENYIEEHNLSSRVKIHGFVNNVYKTLASCHAFVFPSYYEGLGGALIEAFASKLPCLCSSIPVLKEVVGSPNGALFSTPGDIESLANNIYKLYENQDYRNKLSNYAYKRFENSFKLKEINQEMLNMYKSLEINNQ